jgi:predicted transglutaminase-like cysteine proteinase
MISLNDLKLVNTKVNLIEYKEQIGDDWNPFTENGFDCNNYATRKYEELIARGWPKEFLRLATCWTRHNGEGYHAVLIVDYDGQSYVLDNCYPLPMEFQMLPYKWHKIQIAGTRQWEFV